MHCTPESTSNRKTLIKKMIVVHITAYLDNKHGIKSVNKGIYNKPLWLAATIAGFKQLKNNCFLRVNILTIDRYI